MCDSRKFIAEKCMVFGDAQPNARGVSIPLPVKTDFDGWLEVQVLESTVDGDVQVYEGTSTDVSDLRARIPALASELPARPVLVRTYGGRFLSIYANISSGAYRATVIVRSWAEAPKGGCGK